MQFIAYHGNKQKKNVPLGGKAHQRIKDEGGGSISNVLKDKVETRNFVFCEKKRNKTY